MIFGEVSISIASNIIVGLMLVQDDVRVSENKDGGLEPEVDMK